MCFLLSGKAFAESNPQLRDYFTSRITQVQTAVYESTSGPTSVNAFALQNINLDIIPSVSFGVPQVLSLTISPEIDFIFVPTTN
jgi:hypothetical protein